LTNRKTKIELARAQEVRDLHCAAGHPSDKVLKDMLSLGKFKECNLSPTDVDAARSLLGDCTACISANMPEPPSPASHREPPRGDGESFHADIFFVKNGDASKCPYLLVVDDRCAMLIGRLLGRRGAKVLHPAMDTIVNHIHAIANFY